MEEIWIQIQNTVTLYGLKILSALAILIIGLWVAKFIAKMIHRVMEKQNIDETLVKFVAGMVKAILYAFILIAAISEVGVETTSFVAVLGAAGLAIGFALQGSLSNFASGVMLIIFRPFKVGDYIKGGGDEGVVEEIGIFVTVLNTLDNIRIFVPNSKLTGDNISNLTGNDKRRVDMTFGVSYEADIDKTRSIIKEVLDSDSRILKDPAYDIVVAELADSSVNFYARPWVNPSDYWGVHFDVIEKVKKKLDANNISIPFPQRDVHVYEHKS